MRMPCRFSSTAKTLCGLARPTPESTDCTPGGSGHFRSEDGLSSNHVNDIFS